MILHDLHLPHVSQPLGGSGPEMKPGERILLLGPSGSGKTTLFKVIAGFTDPEKGSITPENAQVAMLLQNPFHQIIMQTVRDELHFPLRNAGIPPDEAKTAADRIADILGIVPLMDRDTATLSFGEIQLVMIAATCLTPADIVLLDEPASHLDPPAVRACYRCAELLSAEGKIVCISSQTPDEYEYVDTVWILNDGALTACLSKEAFAADYRSYGILLDRDLIKERLKTFTGAK